ncbi:MAG TPA: glycoside hydrolase domain-containing protein [Candidatus Dormibacteraeota bacterium]|nr:glycoside hydrolase domain-containing protein [Candidatus Dormibacteraeota bacterium]
MKNGKRLAAMKFFALTPVALGMLFAFGAKSDLNSVSAGAKKSYLGFDRNIYPGDAALPVLRKTFAFSSYWLGPPPGEKTNTWADKREILRQNGFGFVVLFRGREEKDFKNEEEASAKGEEDARATVEAAHREGFSSQTIIYLDIEEGGRLSPNYHRYITQWLWHVSPAYFQGGLYCSGIPVKEGKGKTITTCEDILENLAPKSRTFSLWAYNDMCPPSPGCKFPKDPPSPSTVGKRFCDECINIWQFAQSPRRKEFTSRCAPTYYRDGNCYAPGDTAHAWFLDVNSATSADPSGGAK